MYAWENVVVAAPVYCPSVLQHLGLQVAGFGVGACDGTAEITGIQCSVKEIFLQVLLVLIIIVIHISSMIMNILTKQIRLFE